MELFAILCTTCQAKLKVRDVAALGKILACPKCGSMVQVVAPPGWTPPDPAALREIAAEPSTGSTIVDVRKFQPSGDAATSGSTARLSKVIAAERAQANEPRPAESVPSAAPKAAKSPSTIVRTGDLTKAASPPPAGAARQTISAAPPIAAELTPINPDDVPPIPVNEPAPGFAMQWARAVSPRRTLFVATPVVALVALLFLGWYLFAPGGDTGSSDAILQPSAQAPATLSPDTDAPAAPAAVHATSDPARGADNPPPSDVATTDTPDSATVPQEDMADPPPEPTETVAENLTPAADDTADNSSSEPPADAQAAVENAAGAATEEADKENKVIAAPAANLNRAVPAFGAKTSTAALPTTEPTAAEQEEQPRASDAPDEALLGQESMPHVDVTARLADPLLDVEFKRVSLAEFCDFLSRMSTVPITLDVEALAAAGVRPGDTVAIDAESTTVGDALTTVLAKRGLMYLVEGQQVVVTSPDRKAVTLATVSYEVADLATAADDMPRLSAMLTRFVAPTTWQDHGGQGQVKIDGTALSVEQSTIVQRQVASFLDKLRQARGLTIKSELRPEEVTLKTRYSRAKANLDKQVTANFSLETPLIDVLTWLSRTTATRILIDEASLTQAGMWSRSPATVVVDRKPLHEALTALLAPVGMTYRIADERTIQVFARQSLHDRYEFELYPVTDLLAGRLEPKELISRLREQFDPATWIDGGGHGAIEYDEAGKCLVVVQTPESQVRMENLLLRARPNSRPAP